MKKVILLILGVITVALIVFQYKVGIKYQSDLSEIKEEIDEIYELIALNNMTQGNILTNHGRLLHYIAGHQSSQFVNFCPECGLLEQLQIRAAKIDNKITELSEFVGTNPNDPTSAEKIKEIESLQREATLATQKIFSADEQAKELSKLIKVKVE